MNRHPSRIGHLQFSPLGGARERSSVLEPDEGLLEIRRVIAPILFLTGRDANPIAPPVTTNLNPYIDSKNLVTADAPANPAGRTYMKGICDIVQGGFMDSPRQNFSLGFKIPERKFHV